MRMEANSKFPLRFPLVVLVIRLHSSNVLLSAGATSVYGPFESNRRVKPNFLILPVCSLN